MKEPETIFSECAARAVQYDLFQSLPVMMRDFYRECKSEGIDEKDAIEFVCTNHINSARADLRHLEGMRAKAEENRAYFSSEVFIALKHKRDELVAMMKLNNEGVSPETKSEMNALLQLMRTSTSPTLVQRARDRYVQLYIIESNRDDSVMRQIRAVEAEMGAEKKAEEIHAYEDSRDIIENRILLYRKHLEGNQA